MKDLVKTNTLSFIMIAMFSYNKRNNSIPKPQKLSYQFKLLKSSVTIDTGMTAGSSIQWQSGYANVASISFESKNERNHDIQNDFKKPEVYKVDLFNSIPILGNVNMEEGTDYNAEVKLELKQNLTGSALFLKGIYINSAGNKEVEFSLNEDVDQLEITANAKDLNIKSKANYIAVISLHLNKLLEGVTLASLSAATTYNGTIAINKTSNIAIYHKIKSNISSFTSLDYNH